MLDWQTPLSEIFRLAPSQKAALAKLRLFTAGDLLYHFPVRYGDTAEIRNIADLKAGENTVVYARLNSIKTAKAYIKKIPMSQAVAEDESGQIKIVWFHQAYLAKMLHPGSFVRLEGKVSERKAKSRSELGSTTRGELYLSNPKVETIQKIPEGVGQSLFGGEADDFQLYPVYPESKGVTSNWFYHALQRILKAGVLENITDSIPAEILEKYNLPDLNTAILWIHAPKKNTQAIAARKRFAFEEVFLIQLEKQKARLAWKKNPAFTINDGKKDIEKFAAEHFPFTPTEAQWKAVDDILNDFSKGYAMNRLLEGDVGSGKTAVAAATAHAVISTPPKDRKYGRLQVAYMCPTEILAKQHFESFIKFFTHLNLQIGLITSSGCRKFPSKVNPHEATDISRSQLLKWLESGDIPILIGTHSLIQKTVKFKNLAYVIIDEQHRFGTLQRQKLVRKDNIYPHLLSMTATPIPRTLALTIYGDLDLTVVDQMPLGRKQIITEIVLPTDRENTYEKIREQIKAGRQAYVICPRIDPPTEDGIRASDPDPMKIAMIQMKSVTEETKRLQKDIFPEFVVAGIHGKMSTDEKEEIMDEFSNGKINILVATSVIEVGVNVPNSTIIIIEGAERFGLAQLHQLRGRVIRSNHQAYCYVFTETKTAKTVQRLKAFKTAKNGFELAEYDLQFRGAGELSGGKQWGISDVGMEALKNIKMVEAARTEAQKLILDDENLAKYPTIYKTLAKRKSKEIHFE
ncbi:MAG: ATP-dependent DNA helicase RecG [Minisyncoccia bacterium]